MKSSAFQSQQNSPINLPANSSPVFTQHELSIGGQSLVPHLAQQGWVFSNAADQPAASLAISRPGTCSGRLEPGIFALSTTHSLSRCSSRHPLVMNYTGAIQLNFVVRPRPSEEAVRP